MKALDGETRESRRMVPHVKSSKSVGLDISCHYRTCSKLCRDDPVTLWEDKRATRDWGASARAPRTYKVKRIAQSRTDL